MPPFAASYRVRRCSNRSIYLIQTTRVYMLCLAGLILASSPSPTAHAPFLPPSHVSIHPSIRVKRTRALTLLTPTPTPPPPKLCSLLRFSLPFHRHHTSPDKTIRKGSKSVTAPTAATGATSTQPPQARHSQGSPLRPDAAVLCEYEYSPPSKPAGDSLTHK
jgi:hypothetical protein